jgi:SAM-dependent methyltransferase
VARNVLRDEVAGKRILEVGSYDENGTVRTVLEPLLPAEYIGTDMREGPRVDKIVNASDLRKAFGESSFDMVVSLEMLEHAEDWRGAIRGMKAVLRPGGSLILATVSWGFPLHEYPHDYWRYELFDMEKILADMDILVLEPDTLVPGVFVKARRPLSPRPEADLDAIHLRAP